MGLEGLFSELLVASVLYCVNFVSVGVEAHHIVLGEQVGDWVESADNAENHGNDQLCVGNFALGEVGQVF